MLYNAHMNQQTNHSHVPPVVAVLGHVDHGKTTLLDSIRKTDIAGREHGGITQKIGASMIEIMHDGAKRMITFIDTPGHEAFSKMRGRGAQAADIGLLIVSAVDGVMPQTRESIKLLEEWQTPFIVVLTKIDIDGSNPEKIKQQLVRENVLLEGYGGDVPVIEVSARTGKNIKELLELILLVFELQYEQADSPHHIGKANEAFQAIVIESKLDQKVGPKATIVIKKGMIKQKDELIAEHVEAKVRALINDLGVQIKEATVGFAVEILGFETVPQVGSIVYNKIQSQVEKPHVALSAQPAHSLIMKLPEDTLKLILCADTEGSLEAIVAALPTKGLTLITKKTGEIAEADILMAKSTGAIVLAFNTKIRPDVAKFALTERVLAKNYTIIYEMLDEIKDVIEGKRLAQVEQIFGVAKILATFPFDKSTVLGIAIQDGRIAKGDKIRLMRDETVIGESHVVSLRQGKNQTSKVEKNQEAGIIINPLLDFHIGDVILSHS